MQFIGFSYNETISIITTFYSQENKKNFTVFIVLLILRPQSPLSPIISASLKPFKSKSESTKRSISYVSNSPSYQPPKPANNKDPSKLYTKSKVLGKERTALPSFVCDRCKSVFFYYYILF